MSEEHNGQVAIVGMACRFPGAKNIDTFWDNLINGVESITFFSDDEIAAHGMDPKIYQDPNYVKAAGIVDDAGMFDAAFFGMSPAEATLMDPQIRLFLEVAWEGLENAGYDSVRYHGRIGCWAGASINKYIFMMAPKLLYLKSWESLQARILNDKDYIATWTAYKLNLKGPAMSVQTACSTSMVAIHLGCQSLKDGETDMVVAGGSTVEAPQNLGYTYYAGGIGSKDGHCRPFDADADGTISANGAGVVILKRLEDALADRDHIHGVIRATALNNDGAVKVSYMAPSVDGQADAITEALDVADVNPETIGYVEAHGTGTPIGDPIEISALTDVYREHTQKKGYCAIGSVKSNFGHLDVAAGVAGVIKTTLALYHGQIPPLLHYKKPNPAVNFADSPFYPAAQAAKWPKGAEPRRGAVSSFGVGGTNGHAILEEAPERTAEVELPRPFHFFPVSAKTETALETAIANLAAHVAENPDVDPAEVAYTLQTGRGEFDFRRFAVADNLSDAMSMLRGREPGAFTASEKPGERGFVFMFPGQGSQFPGMFRDTYATEPIFADELDACCEMLIPHMDLDPRDLLFPEPEMEAEAAKKLEQTDITQPILFAVEFSLAQLWISWGIEPEAMIGHSVGEYVAATLSGVFSLEDALHLVTVRGRLMRRVAEGSMAAVSLPENQVKPLLGSNLSLAAVNGPETCVVAGPTPAVDALINQLESRHIKSRLLHTSHAFHSAMMEPILSEFETIVRRMELNDPEAPFISNRTGSWADESVTNPSYWVSHLREAVRFSDGAKTLLADPEYVFLEVGPGVSLSSLVKQQPSAKNREIFSSSAHPKEQRNDAEALMIALGRAWLTGAEISWEGFYGEDHPYRTPLPTYPFERRRYWFEADPAAGFVNTVVPTKPAKAADNEAVVENEGPSERRGLSSVYQPPRNDMERTITQIWGDLLGVPKVGVFDNFLELGGQSLLAAQVMIRLSDANNHQLEQELLFESPTPSTLSRAVAVSMLGAVDENRANQILNELGAGDRGSLSERVASLNPESQGLLFEQLKHESLEVEIPPITPRTPKPEGDTLSFSQQRLWFLEQLEEPSGLNNVPIALHLEGLLDREALAWSLNQIIARHEVLRAWFPAEAAVQRIRQDAELEIPLIDLSHLDQAAGEIETQRIFAEEAGRPFDISNDPLLRAQLIKYGDNNHVFQAVMHHIVTDAWSIGVLVSEFASLYNARVDGSPSPLAPLPIQYADFAQWQRDWMKDDVQEDQLAFWRNALAGAPPVLDLPTDRPRPAVQRFNGAVAPLTIDEELTSRLSALGNENSASLFMVLSGAFNVLLSCYTQERDILVGVPVAGRNYAGVQGLIGMFINTIVLRSDCSGDPSFSELLGRIRRSALNAFGHQDLPFEVLIEDLKPERSLSYSPLFQVMFNYHATPMEDLALTGLKTTRREALVVTSRFDITFELTQVEGRLAGAFQYDTDLFDAATIERMINHYRRILVHACDAPATQLSEIPIMDPHERRALLTEWNATGTDYNRRDCFHQLFEAVAAQHPNRIAACDDRNTFTYAQLNERANRLAGTLIERGAGPDRFVGVYCDRSAHMLTGLLAVMKSGSAYLPLDPSYPADRLHFMISETQPPVILTQRDLMGRLPKHDSRLVFLNEEDAYGNRTDNPAVGVYPANLAYTIFTSGSTGKPKGVQISHGALVNFLQTMAHKPGLSRDDVLIAVTTISFDIAGLELYLPLLVGAKVVIADRETTTDGTRLSALIEQQGATVMQATPATWRMLVASEKLNAPNLKILCGGEALPRELAADLLAHTNQVWNVYGPTETTVWSTVQSVTMENLPTSPGETLSIGRPIANTTIYILDDTLKPVPVGVAGALYIGGEGLARGYFNRPDLTAESFVPNPFERDARLYRTGDKARYRKDGALVFLGRIDSQVKLRGFRIELGEIEAVLAKQNCVEQAVLLIREDSPGNSRLVAYVTGEEHLETAALRDGLRRELPEYMIPNAFMQLEEIPLTPNGKVNRRALPAPSGNIIEVEYAAPRTPQEETLCGIFSEVLGHDRVGIKDDFFELGGHSLPATRVISRIRDKLEAEMSVRDIFEASTVEKLALRLAASMGDSAQDAVPFKIVSREGNLPLSSGQTRLWFLDRLEGAGSAYNIPITLRMRGPLNITALNQTLSEILNRHEALRTTFDTRDGSPVQVLHPPAPFEIPTVSIEYLPAENRAEEMKRRVREHANHPFDLAKGPLFKADLLRIGEDDHMLLVNMSHIVSDGWSLGVLLHEFQTLYRAFHGGGASPLPDLPIQYVDFAARQRIWLASEGAQRQVEYWRNQLVDLPPLVEIPTDRPRPKTQTYNGAFYRFKIERAITDELHKLSNNHQASLFMTLLAGLGLMQSRYSGMQDIPIGSPIAGRTHHEQEGLIGFFVNSLVLRMDFSVEKRFVDLLDEVRQTTLTAYAHQDIPFETLVEKLSPERGLNHSPMFQTMLVYQNTSLKAPDMPNLKVYAGEPDTEAARFDMTLFIRDEAQGLACDMEYNTDLFDQATMARMMQHFANILEQVSMDPNRAVSRIKMLEPDEFRRLVRGWNAHDEFPRSATLQDLFEIQAAATPDKPALQVLGREVEGDDLETLSYFQLNARANKVAHYLKKRGVGPDVPIGVCMERTADIVVAILGVLKADACYVPLDPAYPEDRLTYMFEDSQMPIVLTQIRLKERMPDHGDKMICLDADWHLMDVERDQNPSHICEPANLAYTLYTSGSTGKPKAVAIQQANATAMVQWAHTVFTPDMLAATVASTSVCFDLSVFELFVPLTSGGKVVLVENAVHLTALPASTGVTLINTVPSAITELLKVNAVPATTKIVNLAGEPLKNKLVQQIYENTNVDTVYNLYGPSEDTTYSIFGPAQRGVNHEPGIGHVLKYSQAYILDPHGSPTPIGVPGELYLAGAGVARGYLGRPGLTAERFLPDPFGDESGGRLYRTGDKVRYQPDGEMLFLGRIDNQVKLRGFRIELGEIEAVLERHPAIHEAVSLVVEDRSGYQQLVAYVVAKPEQEIQVDALRKHLSGFVPAYMIPASFVPLSAIPLTPNGKTDRKALAAMDRHDVQERAAEYTAPRNELEKQVVALWCEILNVEQIGIHDSFFEMGGNSLMIVQVHEKLKAMVDTDLTVVDLFSLPTVSALVERLGKGHAAEEALKEVDTHVKSQKEALKRRKQKMKKQRRKINV